MACSCPELVQVLRGQKMDLLNPDFRWKVLTNTIHLGRDKHEFRGGYQIVFSPLCWK